MDKNESLKLFYQHNQINISRYSDDNDPAHDPCIARLSSQVDRWLEGIDPADHELFLTLLSRYDYLTRAQCERRYDRLLDLLEEKLREKDCNLSEVLFVTFESSHISMSGADSVRADLYNIGQYRIRKSQIVAAHRNVCAQDLEAYQAIVFLDDIVGSGVTLWNGIDEFCERYSIHSDSGFLLFYACIVPREHGIKHIEDNCNKAGYEISGLFDPLWYAKPAFEKGSVEYHRVEKYERMVGDYLLSDKTFFMGFQKNRLLVSFYYSTPNNTLCTFWRKTPDNTPPFPRDKNQPEKGPSVSELVETRTKRFKRAYMAGKLQRNKGDSGLDWPDRFILGDILRYRQFRDLDLSQQLNCPRTNLQQRLDSLIEQNYLSQDNDCLTLTEKGLGVYLPIEILHEIEDQGLPPLFESFDWTDLYIPASEQKDN